MKLGEVHSCILYSLSQFYRSLNLPLVEKPLLVQTSKIAFIELLLKSGLFSKHERAIYKNLETLQKKKLIAYDQKTIKLTEAGLRELKRINEEISQYSKIEKFFLKGEKPTRKLQTVIKG